MIQGDFLTDVVSFGCSVVECNSSHDKTDLFLTALDVIRASSVQPTGH